MRAYTIYLQLSAPGPDADKARAELSNVQKQLKSSKSSSQKQQQLKTLESKFEKALKTKTLDGKKGALALLKALVDLDFFGPKYAEYQSALLDQLDKQLDEVLDAFWSVKKTVDAESNSQSPGSDTNSKQSSSESESSKPNSSNDKSVGELEQW